MWDLPPDKFHVVMAFAQAQEIQSTEAIRDMIQRATKDDMAPGIAVAVMAGTKAAE